MNIADYWPMVREYSMWNTTIASLQFWTADLDPITLGRATEEVYSTFFYSTSTHTLHQQSDKILFDCLMIALNAAFDQPLSLADEDYESGSDTINLPTSIRKMPGIHHVSSIEHASFDPEPLTPWNTSQTPPWLVCRWLSLSSRDDDNTLGDTPPTPRATPASTPEYLEDEEEEEEEEEDFKMVPLDNDHWTTEEITDRTLCIHEHALPHGLCPYPYPYIDSLDLSDISDSNGIMIMSSNDDIPALEDMPY